MKKNMYPLWNENIAKAIAKTENIILNKKHWEIIYLIRKCYDDFNIIPPSRMLFNIIKKKLGKKYSNNIYILSLFPKGIAKQANKIAGLPKSNICL
ncbi:TusE/DsrC/DsvC family sulfur relay protein [Buchnera aphidicola]|uniref:TusE/DsrC/DsvC family sulfur relay protein n=1 Tax=Buchnera aphidicola TaxID=9 RepID=UPI003463FDB8